MRDCVVMRCGTGYKVVLCGNVETGTSVKVSKSIGNCKCFLYKFDIFLKFLSFISSFLAVIVIFISISPIPLRFFPLPTFSSSKLSSFYLQLDLCFSFHYLLFVGNFHIPSHPLFLSTPSISLSLTFSPSKFPWSFSDKWNVYLFFPVSHLLITKGLHFLCIFSQCLFFFLVILFRYFPLFFHLSYFSAWFSSYSESFLPFPSPLFSSLLKVFIPCRSFFRASFNHHMLFSPLFSSSSEIFLLLLFLLSCAWRPSFVLCLCDDIINRRGKQTLFFLIFPRKNIVFAHSDPAGGKGGVSYTGRGGE